MITDIKKLLKVDYAYPDPSDPELQYKLYEKREFYYHKIPDRPEITDYNDIKEYRDNICARQFTLHEHQAMLSNFINPNTPYKGVLVFHGLGSGKCQSKKTMVCINEILYKIEDIWKNNKTNIFNDNEGGEWSNPKMNLIVNSYNEKTGKIEKKKVLHLYREKVDTFLREIVLDNGSKITITDLHQLLTINGFNNILNIGDFIGIPKSPTISNIINISYSKIIEINRIKYNDYVYDLEIEDNHNFIAENIICHNTCVGIAIAEKFKSLVQKYNTKIIVLVGGPLIKENWKHHILKCTGETYLKYQDKSVYIDEAEKIKAEKNALIQALQYYKFMSYKSFYKHVIGEKITDNQAEKKGKATYRKTDEGEFERDIAVDRIYNLNNTVIIVDEAHNLTGNTYGDALKYIIKNSINLKIVLMTGTPMKNLGSDIIELINFLRPIDNQVEREKIFDNNKGHLMTFKPGGLEYLKNMIRGYVSHVRGADPLTYAKRVDKGIKPHGLLFTKVIKCYMFPFQKKTYEEAIEQHKDDTLDRKSEAVANFVFPGLSNDRKELIGYYAGEGLNLVKNQLKVNGELINKKLSQKLFGNDNEKDLIYITQDMRSISGKILKIPYLKYFSIKFYKTLKKLSRLVWGKKGPSTAFVYSNLVRVGISIFNEILLQNGYLEYQEDSNNYNITSDTICYFCGKRQIEHKSDMILEKYQDDINNINNSDTDTSSDTESIIENLKISETSSEYTRTEKIGTLIPPHTFYPAVFVTITGKSSDDAMESIPEDKINIIKNVFNNIENKNGKYIKIVLGSRVMNEGISLYYVSEVHILDAYFNFGRIDQVIGRAIRYCSHYKLMNENNIYPIVNVYKYVVAIENGLSTEEELYKKAEMKYLLIKKIERAMKEAAIDCPLNIHGNMFIEEITKYKDCGDGENKEPCPDICDYTKCDYKCDDSKLNIKYYDPDRKIYTKILKDKLDYSTFTHGLARNEIDYVKDKIKEMYITGYMYVLQDILNYVKNTYDEDKRELFDEFFAFKALDELIPATENDFNNFKDTIIDKHNRQGYLIYINKYYIYQPFDQNEDVPMYYRTTVTKNISHQLSLYNYLKSTATYQQLKDIKGKKKVDDNKVLIKDDQPFYNFDDAMEYYDSREEYDYVGFIDKELSRRKMKSLDENKDIFKLREKRAKILEKKRATGIPSLKGAVCSTAKSKRYLDKVASNLKVITNKNDTRTEVCKKIEQKMLLLEKYSTIKDKNKFTYVMIPVDHPIYKFPYNLEDRVNNIIEKIKNEVNVKLDINIKTKKKTSNEEKGYISYYIHIKDDNKIKDYIEFIKNLGGIINGQEWIINVE